MSLLWVDSFGQYGGPDQSIMLNGLYADVGLVGTNSTNSPKRNALVTNPDPVAPNTVFRIGNNETFSSFPSLNLRRVFPAGKTTVGIALRLWLSSLPLNSSEAALIPIRFKDASNVELFNIEVDPSGRLVVWRGTLPASPGSISRTTVLGTTSVPVITANAWQHIEVKATFSSTVGSVEIRVQGVTVLTLSTVNTSPSNNQAYNWEAFTWLKYLAPAAPYMYIQDLIAWDTSGSYNNDFMGTVQVAPLMPDSDVTLGDWTLTGGTTGWEILDNVPPDDAKYISADPSGTDQAEFTMQDVANDVSSIRAAAILVRASKSDAGDGSIQVGIKRSSSELKSGDIPLTTAPTYYLKIFETDPVTGNPITPAQMNDMKLVIDRTL